MCATCDELNIKISDATGQVECQTMKCEHLHEAKEEADRMYLHAQTLEECQQGSPNHSQ